MSTRLSVLEDAAVTDLTTVAAAHSFLELDPLDVSRDELIASLIRQASAAIVDYTGRQWAERQYLEICRGTGGTELLLTHTPIIGTPTITLDSSPVVDFMVDDVEAGVLYRKLRWTAAPDWGWNIEPAVMPGASEPNFYVTYYAGYVLRGGTALAGADSRALPESIERACLIAVGDWLKRVPRDNSISSKKVGDLATSYKSAYEASPAIPLPGDALALLPRRIS